MKANSAEGSCARSEKRGFDASGGKIHQQPLRDDAGTALRIETRIGPECRDGQRAREIDGEKGEVCGSGESGSLGALRGGMIEFKKLHGGPRAMQSPGEQIETGTEHDDLRGAGSERGGGAVFEPELAREVVRDDAGQYEALGGEQ